MKQKSLAVFLVIFSSVSLFAEKYYISFEQSEYEVSSYLKECLSASNPINCTVLPRQSRNSWQRTCRPVLAATRSFPA